MSWAIVDRVFETDLGLGGAAKAVLLSLANHCDDDGGSSYPGQDKIEIETGLSLDTIQRGLRALRTGGWISRKKRPVVQGQWASWEYQIKIEKLAPPSRSMRPGDRAAPRGLDKNDRAAKCGRTGPQDAVGPGRKVRLKPVLEPVLEPSRAREPNSNTERGGSRRAEVALDPLGPLAEELRRQIDDPAAFDAWFSDGKASFVSLDKDGLLTLAAQTKFRADYIAENFKNQILASAPKPGAERLVVVVRVDAATPSAAS